MSAGHDAIGAVHEQLEAFSTAVGVALTALESARGAGDPAV